MPLRAPMATDRSAPSAGVTAWLPRATWNAFDELAQKRRITKSELARELIEKFVDMTHKPDMRE